MNLMNFFLRRPQLSLMLASVLLLPIGFSVSAEEIKMNQGPVYTEAELAQRTPTSPNPYLSLLPPSVQPDYDHWQSVGYWDRLNHAGTGKFISKASATINEVEPNSTYEDAQVITDFTPTTTNQLFINANFVGITQVESFVYEDNGSIPKAVDTGVIIGTVTSAVTYLGDGPHGSSGTKSGDFDFYKTGYLHKNELLQVITYSLPGESLDTFVSLWNESGELIYANDDSSFASGGDSNLLFQIEEDGEYYICVGTYNNDFNYFRGKSYPRDPFESGSGEGVFSEGFYNISISVNDIDVFQLDLQAGDVIGFSAGVNSPPQIMTLDKLVIVQNEFGVETPTYKKMISTQQNAAPYIYPARDPDDQRIDHNALFTYDDIHGAYVIGEDGTYFLTIAGAGFEDYIADIRIFRAPLEATLPQKIYITVGGGWYYDGADALRQYALFIDPSVWGSPYTVDDNIVISPLLSFMEEMGLSADVSFDSYQAYFDSDYNKVLGVIESRFNKLFPSNIDIVMPDIGFWDDPEVLANIFLDPEDPDYVDPFTLEPKWWLFENAVRPWNDTTSSQVFVMGTQVQVAISTIGISESIDPGNFDSYEQAIVLLDTIATTTTSEDVELNGEQFDLVGEVLASVIAHEIGHFTGAYHVDFFNERLDVMDQFYTLGLGPDGVFNTRDDRRDSRVFGKDQYSTLEGFKGEEDTGAVIYWGVGAGVAPVINFDSLFVNYNMGTNGIGTETEPFNKAFDAVSVVNPGGTVNLETGTGAETFSGANQITTPMTLNKVGSGGVVRIGE